MWLQETWSGPPDHSSDVWGGEQGSKGMANDHHDKTLVRENLDRLPSNEGRPDTVNVSMHSYGRERWADSVLWLLNTA